MRVLTPTYRASGAVGQRALLYNSTGVSAPQRVASASATRPPALIACGGGDGAQILGERGHQVGRATSATPRAASRRESIRSRSLNPVAR